MKRPPKLLGLDIGFGFTKCVDGERTVIFPSTMRRGIENIDGANGLTEGCYGITVADGDYRVGDDTGSPSLFEDFARRPDRLLDSYGKNLALTAIAAFSMQECPLHVVVGLPIAHAPQWETPLVDRLTGYHKIGIYQPDGRSARQNIHIRKVHVVPHPLGTFTSLIMDPNGRFQDSAYQAKKVALVDVGFRTTNVMIMTSARFVNRGSGTIDMGIANGFEAIAHKLYRETQCIPDLHRLYSAIRMGFIRIEDQEYNLKHLREETFRQLSSALADRINYSLKDDWDLENVLLTGGGASDLAEDLAPLIDNDVVLIEHDQDVRLNNAQGQLRLARHLWGATGLCTNDK
jgi:plasmid segregation protein ParM